MIWRWRREKERKGRGRGVISISVVNTLFLVAGAFTAVTILYEEIRLIGVFVRDS